MTDRAGGAAPDGRRPRLDHGEPSPHVPRGGPVPVPLPDRHVARRQPTRPDLRPGRPVPGQLLSGRCQRWTDHARACPGAPRPVLPQSGRDEQDLAALRHGGGRGLHLGPAHHRGRREEGRQRRHERRYLHAPRVGPPPHAPRPAHVTANPRGHPGRALGYRHRDHEGVRRHAHVRERRSDHPGNARPWAFSGVRTQLLPYRLRGARRLRGRLARQRRPRPGDVLEDTGRRALGHQRRRQPYASA